MEGAFCCMEELKLVSSWVMEFLHAIDPLQFEGLTWVYWY